MTSKFFRSHLARTLAVIVAFAANASTGRAQLTFTDRASFTAASGTLANENLDAVVAAFPTLSAFAGVWDSTGIGSPGNAAGTIFPGLQISIVGGDGIFLGIARSGDLGNFTNGATDGWVFSNQNAEGAKLELIFTNGVTTAAGFDYFNNAGGGTSSTQIQVFDLGNALLFSGASSPPLNGAFFGITTTVGISRITIENSANGFSNIEGVDNIAFGAAIPEASTASLVGLGIIVGGAFGWIRRRTAR